MSYRSALPTLCLIASLAGGCGSGPTLAPSSPATASPGSVQSASIGATSSLVPSPSAEVTPNPVGFAFAAQDVLTYYSSIGYRCAPPDPSRQAAGYQVQTCQSVDSAGRTLTIGLVTDQSGALGNAFASVQEASTDGILDPTDAMDLLSGFLGATLGGERGGPLVDWLAAHAGDAYAETTDGGLKIATYTPAADDHSAIFVELANQPYLQAPRPSGG